MLMDDTVLSMNKKRSTSSTERANEDMVNQRSGGTSKLRQSIGTVAFKLGHVLYVQNIVYSGVSVDGCTVQFTKSSCVIKKK